MATDETLIFSGARFTAARISDRYQMPSIESVLAGAPGAVDVIRRELPKPGQSQGQAARRRLTSQRAGPTPCTIFSLELPGGGRSWETTKPEAFWRNFAELDFVGGDGADVVRFVQRHGEPFDALAGGLRRTLDTLNWISAAAELKKIAQAWEPPDRDGISKLTRDQPRLYLAENTLLRALSVVCETFTVVTDVTNLDLVRRAGTLHGFMVASAASAFRQKDSMRRCDHCGDWFKPGRRDMRFCSNSCRATNATSKER